MKKIIKIAVTGGAAAGKSTVCKFFSEKGVKVISLDKLSRDVVLPGGQGYARLVKYFGAEILLSDKSLDRALLRKLITEAPETKKAIEEIVQPEIINSMHALINKYESAGEPFVVIEVPLLYETGMETLFDACILVYIDSDIQISRLMERDGVTKEEAVSLINIQMPQSEKMKRAEFIVENTGAHDALLSKTAAVFEKILEKTVDMSKSLDR